MRKMLQATLKLTLGTLLISCSVFLYAQKEKASNADRSAGNPVKATPDSIESGKKLYSDKCEMCHGEKADGTGEMAAMLDTKPANLTDPKGVGKLTDKEIFNTITEGKGAMPRFSDTAEKDRWNLVNYIRSIEAEPASSSSGDSSNKN